MKSITIIGAGMAGLLAANMLRRHSPVIKERQLSVPANHSALLRFRSTAVSDATGVPFQKVLVHKGIWDGRRVVETPTIPLANIYSLKVTGEVGDRSIWNLAPEVRWLAPSDFVAQISQGVNIKQNTPFSLSDFGGWSAEKVAISTIPMPLMMNLTRYQETTDKPPITFTNQPIFTIKAKVALPRVTVFQTLYNACVDDNWYRATLHGDELTIELVNDPLVEKIPVLGKEGDQRAWAVIEHDSARVATNILHRCFGLTPQKIAVVECQVRHQELGKIVPIDEEERKAFILWLTEKYHIYSLGRFATWRSILLDDVVKDIKQIERMITNPSNYSFIMTNLNKQ